MFFTHSNSAVILATRTQCLLTTKECLFYHIFLYKLKIKTETVIFSRVSLSPYKNVTHKLNSPSSFKLLAIIFPSIL